MAQCADQLADLADRCDISGEWPAESLSLLSEFDIWKWVIPTHYGGAPLDGRARIDAYQTLARGCLSTALIVTQQHGACEFIVEGDNELLKQGLLSELATGKQRCTLGISQLTTSHSRDGRVLSARPDGDGHILNGTIPWSTGPGHCQFVVSAAVVEPDKQILVCMPLETPGISLRPAMSLMALGQSHTTAIHCNRVFIPQDMVIRGPCERAITRRSTIKPFTVSAVGLGHALALLEQITSLAGRYDDSFKSVLEVVNNEFNAVQAAIHNTASHSHEPDQPFKASDIRVMVNDLVSRLALCAMILAKGSGFVQSHRVQRLLREAMFLLVWSAPNEVQYQTMARLLKGWGAQDLGI